MTSIGNEPKVEETKPEEPKVEETKAEEAKAEETKAEEKAEPVTSSSVFSMFGGGKKEKKVEEERGDTSGSNKAQREAAEAAAAAKKGEDDDEDKVEESEDIHFEPVIKLTEKVEIKTNEESEECLFKMRSKLFKYVNKSEWKERGTGDVRLLKHKENGKTRLVMRRDKTLKVCANHYITPDMNLQAHVSSDRSWVWSAAADVSDGEAESMTLAIRFGNPENANLFKEAFEKSKADNAALFDKKAEEPSEE